MTKHLPLSAFLLICSISAVAQPVLQASDINYTAGESYTLHLCDWVSAGSAGANQIWDFSNVSENATATIDILSASATPAASSFPNANIAAYVSAQGTYSYFDVNSSSVSYHGVSVSGTNIPYSNPEDFYTYPLTYSFAGNDAFAASFFSSGYNWNRSGTIATNVDAYGTLITPLGTYTDVLRLKIEEDYDDEPVGVPQVQNTTTELYHFYKAGVHYPIVVVTTFVSGGFPQYLFQYIDVTTGIGESETMEVAVYPNPTTDFLNIVGQQFNKATYEILDCLGQIVKVGYLDSKQLDISELNSGIYILHVTMQSGESGMTRFQVAK